MESNSWKHMLLGRAVHLNPKVTLRKANTYPFVEMAVVDPESRNVCESEQRVFKGSGAKFLPNDTLMARITPCLENGKIARFQPSDLTSPGFGSTEFIVIRGREGVTDNDFTYYLVRSPDFRKYAVSQMTGSSGRQRVPPNSLVGFEVHVPPLYIQRHIATILGSFDDKIELNRRMNYTLEQIAQVFFKSWFVDFDPVRAKAGGDTTAGGLLDDLAALFPDRLVESELGRIPDGWEVKALDKIANYLNGLACQKYPPTEEKESLPVIKIRELRQGITVNSDRVSTKVPTKYFVRDGDVLFSWSGSLLISIWSSGSGVLNQHLFKVTSPTYQKWYYYQATKHHLEEFQRIAAGKTTTMGHIQRHHISSAKMAVPPPELLSQSSQIFGAIMERRINALKQIHLLSQLRDTLLPKLLSGELKIPDAEAATQSITR